MEAKFLASVISFLSIFLAIYADFDYETAIYYGDSNVNIGEPFSITCIVPLTEPIFWLKDGEPITRHNLRHGRDEHSYTLSESAIEGEKHKIEAHLSVRHALKVHEGQYKCNNLHTSYHMLHVRSANEAPTHPQTYTPFVVTAGGVGSGGDGDIGGGGVGQLSTLSAYETIHDLTPSSADDIFTRIWEPHLDVELTLPTQTTTTTTSTHRRQHHHHHQQQQQLLQQQQRQREQYKATNMDEQQQRNKLIYINATNLDGNPSLTLPDSSSEGGSMGSELDTGLVNIEYITPPKKYGEMTTAPSRPGGGIGVAKYPPMPNFPPPRLPTQATTTTIMPPHYHTEQHHSIYGITASNSNSNSNNMHRNPLTTYGYQPFDETQSTFPLQTVLPNYQQPTATQMFTPPQQTLVTPGNIYQQQTFPPHQYITQQQQKELQRQSVSGMSTIMAAGGRGGMSFPTTALSPQTTPTAQQVPMRKETDFLVPNFDNAEHQLKVFEIKSPLVLSCNITKEGSYELKWEKNGTDVTKVKSLEGRYRILADERKFIIDRTAMGDDGVYSCVADNQKRNINVIARVIVRVPSNSGVVEGEKLSIVCSSIGTDPQLSWMIGNLTITNSTGRYILKPDDHHVKNAILSVENISLDDRGEFKCIGRNDANKYTELAEASDVSFVRVKGKLAALWPFLGICAEVLTLCAIILIYEKRRNKSEVQESDTDPQDHQSSISQVKSETLEHAETYEVKDKDKEIDDDEPFKIIRLHSDWYYRHKSNDEIVVDDTDDDNNASENIATNNHKQSEGSNNDSDEEENAIQEE